MRIQPTMRHVYSSDEARPGSYWGVMAGMLLGSLHNPRGEFGLRPHILMIGSCGWTIAKCFYEFGGRADWYGLEPDDAMRSMGEKMARENGTRTIIGAFKTIAEVNVAARGIAFDAVIVDAYVLDKPVPEWQFTKAVISAFDVKSGGVVIFHGDITSEVDKFRVVRV